jgi:hypothetical protein
MLFSWNNSSGIYMQVSSSPVVLVTSNNDQDHNNPHDCTWDGDDIVSNQAVRVAHPVCIKTDFINLYLDKMRSKISNAIWQPPKIT